MICQCLAEQSLAEKGFVMIMQLLCAAHASLGVCLQHHSHAAIMVKHQRVLGNPFDDHAAFFMLLNVIARVVSGLETLEFLEKFEVLVVDLFLRQAMSLYSQRLSVDYKIVACKLSKIWVSRIRTNLSLQDFFRVVVFRGRSVSFENNRHFSVQFFVAFVYLSVAVDLQLLLSRLERVNIFHGFVSGLKHLLRRN